MHWGRFNCRLRAESLEALRRGAPLEPGRRRPVHHVVVVEIFPLPSTQVWCTDVVFGRVARFVLGIPRDVPLGVLRDHLGR